MKHIYQYIYIYIYIYILINYIFRYTFGPYIIRNGIATFLDVNKKTSLYMSFYECFIVKYSYGFFNHLFIQQINSRFIYQYVWFRTINNDFSTKFTSLIMRSK